MFAQAQTISEILNNNERIVYWFEMGIEYSEPDDYAHKFLIISQADDKLKEGTIKEFEKSIYNALKHYHFCIGYYNSKQEAEEAKEMYAIFSGKDKDELNQTEYPSGILKSFSEEVYWYVLHPFEGEKQWHLIRKPGALTKGTNEDFFIFVKENLLMQVMTMGPYIYGQTAEDSKEKYRLKNESEKKEKKYPFNFKGIWTYNVNNEKIILDFNKGLKTRITYSFSNIKIDSVLEKKYIKVVNPKVITFNLFNKNIMNYDNLTYNCLFLSDDMTSAFLKIYGRNSSLIGEFRLKKEE